MTDVDLRLAALELAVQGLKGMPATDTDLVHAANKFYRFLKG